MTNVDPKSRLIVALDVKSAEKAKALAGDLAGHVGALKVGFELFTAAGPALVRELVEMGHRIFLDLKYHDIPNTVAGAARAAASLDVFMLNVHATGGAKMMSEAAKAVAESAESIGVKKPLAIAVTVLTSMSEVDMELLGIRGTPKEVALKLAGAAAEAGMDGVVASAHEAAVIKSLCGEDFVVVTPGIRPEGTATQDQKRIMTPGDAIKAGSDYLVVGRPIHGAPSPADAAKQIVAQIEKAL